MIDLNNKTVLITGGTGSFGKSFAKYLLDNFNLKKLIIFSRDEFKQFQMEKDFNDRRLRFFIGDVRDKERLERAFHRVDIVVHAAALKQVPILEYNPFEAVQTNIIGSQNVINAAIDQGVEKALLISTDKAAQPVNLYGATKLCAEKLFVNGNFYASGRTKFSCVRYGNVIGSRGSIVDVLLNNNNGNKLQLTDERMTRFWITLGQSHELVMFALEHMVGGEIFIPKIPSMKIVDLFKAVVGDVQIDIIGIRPGEKLHEVLLTEQEALHSMELERYYVVLPEFMDLEKYKKYFEMGDKLEAEFRFTSDTNKEWLTHEQFRDFIKKK